MSEKLQPGDALLIVDVQNDFFPAGALPVADGDKIIPTVNQWITAAQKAHIPIFISRDWHPHNHCSFQTYGGRWPAHCVQNTQGAEFHAAINVPKNAILISKAFTRDKDAYSAFEGITPDGKKMADHLRAHNITRLWVCGLALDYCVRASAIDARALGIEVHVLLAATRPVAKETGEKTLAELRQMQIMLDDAAEIQ